MSDFPRPGQCVEALDLVGYWCKAKVVRWIADGESIGPEPDDAGPGFEVQYDGWKTNWNRVVSPEEMRVPTQTDSMDKSCKRKVTKNVRSLHLHPQQIKLVHVDGVYKNATILNIDPILNIVNAMCGDERLILTTINFEPRLDEEQGYTGKQTEKNSKSRKQNKKAKKDVQRNTEKQHKKVKSGHMKAICSTPNATPHMESHSTGKTCLPMVLGKEGFFKVGDISSFLGIVILINMINMIGDTVSLVCNVCIVRDEIVTGIEDGCEIRARPDQLEHTSAKPSNSMKRFLHKLSDGMVLSMKDCTVTDSKYHKLVRQLKIGYFLRNACKDLLHSRSLKKTISTINDIVDFSIFQIEETSHSANYTICNGYGVLDKIMGAKWDVHPCSNHHMSHFNFIRSVGVSISLETINFILMKGLSTAPMDNNYRSIVIQEQCVPVTDASADIV